MLVDVENEILLDLLIERVKFWTDDQDVIDLYKSMYENYFENDLFSEKFNVYEIVDNDYNLSVSSYIEQEDTREVIDINTVNMEIVDVVKRIRELQNFIDDLTAKNAI